ncbi:MAG: hypothetical protein IH822_02745 [Chloroflexi bacterium]|nr:hypothetical protein [Chloroflexota bacterium]
MRAVGLRSAVAILVAITGVSLAVGSANAETAALAEREAPDSADSGVRDATPTAGRAEQRRERRELRSQRGEKRLAHARVVLFDGIELSAEQSRGVDAIIEAQLEYGRRSVELRTELGTAQQQGDTERIRAIRAESRPLRKQRKSPDECIEEMRALLSEEQRPIFDMNRARLAAEVQQPRKERRKRRRSGADAEVKAEEADVKAEGAGAEVKAE